MVVQTIKNGISHAWPSLIIISITLIAVRIGYHHRHRDRFVFYREFWSLLAVLYLILFYDLVTNVEFNASSGFNIIPFNEILRYEIGTKMFYYNVIGNIGLFIPFGFIIAKYIKPKKVWTNFSIGLLVSSTIELVQLYIGRSFDIDDILLNVLGCIIGYLIYLFIKLIHRKLPKFMKSNWFNNSVCIIILICIVIYVLKIMGVSLVI